jgi:hypothetical protein
VFAYADGGVYTKPVVLMALCAHHEFCPARNRGELCDCVEGKDSRHTLLHEMVCMEELGSIERADVDWGYLGATMNLEGERQAFEERAAEHVKEESETQVQRQHRAKAAAR